MANKLTITGGIVIDDGDVTIGPGAIRITPTTSGSNYSIVRATLPSGIATQLPISAPTSGSVGYSFLMNTSSSGTIQVGQVVSATFYPISVMNPGEFSVLRLYSNGIYGKASIDTDVLVVVSQT